MLPYVSLAGGTKVLVDQDDSHRLNQAQSVAPRSCAVIGLSGRAVIGGAGIRPRSPSPVPPAGGGK